MYNWLLNITYVSWCWQKWSITQWNFFENNYVVVRKARLKPKSRVLWGNLGQTLYTFWVKSATLKVHQMVRHKEQNMSECLFFWVCINKFHSCIRLYMCCPKQPRCSNIRGKKCILWGYLGQTQNFMLGAVRKPKNICNHNYTVRPTCQIANLESLTVVNSIFASNYMSSYVRSQVAPIWGNLGQSQMLPLPL